MKTNAEVLEEADARMRSTLSSWLGGPYSAEVELLGDLLGLIAEAVDALCDCGGGELHTSGCGTMEFWQQEHRQRVRP